MSILEKGGNAFDAAVATAFTLQGSWSRILNGPGRRRADHRSRCQAAAAPRVICGQRSLLPPAQPLRTIPQRGPGIWCPGTEAAGGLVVPGTFESLDAACCSDITDTLRLRVRPGARHRLLARDCYPLVERALRDHQNRRAAVSANTWPTSAAVYLPNNEVPKPGTLFTNRGWRKPIRAY